MRFLTMQSKDVIEASTGKKIGFVVDVEIDCQSLCILSIIVEKMSVLRFLCLLKGPPCLCIPISHIISIGEDVILVNIEC